MSINGVCANCEHWDTRAISVGEFVCELDGRLCNPSDTCERLCPPTWRRRSEI